MRVPQCLQVGASAWMAHSKLSKVCDSPFITTLKALSYSLPQVSQVAMPSSCHAARRLRVRAAFLAERDRAAAGRLAAVLPPSRLLTSGLTPRREKGSLCAGIGETGSTFP